MHLSRRNLLLAASGATASHRLFGQSQHPAFRIFKSVSLAPIPFRDETIRVAVCVTKFCAIDITLGGTTLNQMELKAETPASQRITGLPKTDRMERAIEISSVMSTPGFSLIFEPGGRTPASSIEAQAAHARFTPQPVARDVSSGDIIASIDSPADAAVEIRRIDSGQIVRTYRVNDLPQGKDVRIPWDLLDNNKMRVPQGTYLSELTLIWKNGSSPTYVVSSIPISA
jgi:hypothetical protein